MSSKEELIPPFISKRRVLIESMALLLIRTKFTLYIIKKKYPIHNSYDSLLYVTYFPEPDTIFEKSINSSFMYITNLSDNPKDNQPVYKAEIKNKHTSGAHQITLLLMSKMAGHRIHFNIK